MRLDTSLNSFPSIRFCLYINMVLLQRVSKAYRDSLCDRTSSNSSITSLDLVHLLWRDFAIFCSSYSKKSQWKPLRHGSYFGSIYMVNTNVIELPELKTDISAFHFLPICRSYLRMWESLIWKEFFLVESLLCEIST